MTPSTEPVVLVVPPTGFPGAPFLAVVTRLQDVDIPFVAASEDPGICHANDGVRVTASRPFSDKRLLELPAVIVFGDRRGWLARSGALRAFLTHAVERGRLVCAIGWGLWPLAEAGLLRGHEVADVPELDGPLTNGGALRLEAPCVVSGSLLTATDEGAGVLVTQLLGMAGVHGSPLELR
jgi:protease I